ncbi:outer membrane protein [Kistimonas asteriae]|uniref:outer membrane protein n=1 Tax=Kistimonas asteriae TaxID=517724 RepID=UPI001BAA2D4C|nr:outer membrane beta-barrel protein [Kistimonas asteriae]
MSISPCLRMSFKGFLTFITFCIPTISHGDDYYLKGLLGYSHTESKLKKDMDVINQANKVIIDSYENHDKSDNAAVVGLGAGIDFNYRTYRLSVGAAWYWQNEIKNKGYIDLHGEGSFRDYSYQYKTQHQRLMLEGAFYWLMHEPELQPYISAGLGYSRNRFTGYSEKDIFPTDSTAKSPDPITPFKSATRNEPAWQIGIGILIPISEELLLDMGYQYANLGKVESGRDKPGRYSGKLKTDDLTSQQLLLGLIWHF